MDTPPTLRLTPLHDFGDAIREALTAVPTSAARALFIAVLAVLLIWVLRLPRERTRPAEGEPAGWSSNLKLWAALALVIQITIYLIF